MEFVALKYFKGWKFFLKIFQEMEIFLYIFKKIFKVMEIFLNKSYSIVFLAMENF